MRMTTKATLLAGAMALGMAVAAPTGVMAQDSQSQAEPRTDWSDQKLQGFVTAALDVQSVYEEWRPRIDEAENAENAQEMRQKANDSAVQAVEESPISVEEYTEINRAMQTNPEFYEEVRTLLDAAQ